jgi:endonuclease/exonuclease/phosphatase (EEP) superfamily protein YafD
VAIQDQSRLPAYVTHDFLASIRAAEETPRDLMRSIVALSVKWVRRLVQALAVMYPLSLLGVTVALRYVGEDWWMSTVGLYLPRLGFALPLPFLAVALRMLRMPRLLWLQMASVILVAFPLMGFVLPSPTPVDRNAPTMRVLSFNVNSGLGGIDQVVGEIDHYAPDVVLLQETGGHEAREAFGRLLGARYPTVEISGQFIVAARYPLSPGSSSSASVPPDPEHARAFQREAFDTPLGRVVFYDVHTVSPRAALYGLRGREGLSREIASGRILRGAGTPLVESNAHLRLSQVQAFSEAAAQEEGSVVIAGDSNLPDLSPVLHRYLSGYEDGFLRAGWGLGYTFPTDKLRPWMRIDRILANGRLRFVRFEVGRTRASDHRCVVADLQRP